jgi:hypothetical protein
VRRPRAFTIRLLYRLAGRIDPAEAAAYEEAARKAFQTGTLVDAPKPSGSVPSAESAGSLAARPLGSLAGRTGPQAELIAKRSAPFVAEPTGETLESHVATAEEPAVADRLPDRNSRDVGDSAQDLLRTPRSVTSVADDFFDGLIRRVEGDR